MQPGDDMTRDRARSRRASVLAITTLPGALFLLVLVGSAISSLGWKAPLGAYWLTGFVLAGPFASHAASASSIWLSPTLAWLAWGTWALSARHTPIGDMHWLLHAAITFIWMMFGYFGFLRVALST